MKIKQVPLLFLTLGIPTGMFWRKPYTGNQPGPVASLPRRDVKAFAHLRGGCSLGLAWGPGPLSGSPLGTYMYFGPSNALGLGLVAELLAGV